MRVTQLSTWRSQCGIAEYTGFLTEALTQNGIECDVVAIDRQHAGYLAKHELRAYFDELTEQFEGADLVHIQHEFGFFSGSYHFRASVFRFRQALRAALRAGRPVVVTFHTIPFSLDLASLNWSSGDPVKSLLTVGARACWRAAIAPLVNRTSRAHAIVHTRTARRMLVDSGIGDRGVSIIPHGNPAPRPPVSWSERAEARARLGLAEDATVVGLFGFMSRAKGHMDAVQALELLPKNYQLLIAGGPHPLDRQSALSDILDHVADHDELARRLAVTGFLERDDAERCLDAVDIMVAPYRDTSQISSGALGWALASGKPVIASSIPVFQELAEDAACVELVPPRSPGELALAIHRLADDAGRGNALVANARAWCEQTSWSEVAAQHADLYTSLLSGAEVTPRRAVAPTAAARPSTSSLDRPLVGLNERLAFERGGPGERFLPARGGAPVALRPATLPLGKEVVFAVDPHAVDDPLVQALNTRGYPGDLPALLVLHLLRGGGTFVDVGAHLGTFSLAAAAQGSRVLAVEASMRSAQMLRTAAAYNDFDQMTVVHGAAAARSGALRFRSNDAWGHVVLDAADGDVEEVPAHAVGELVAALGWDHVDLLKIDVEGYEVEALRGMESLLASDRVPMILFEANSCALASFGQTLASLKRAVADHGYELLYVDRERPGRLAPIRPEEIQPEAVADYLAYKGELPDLAPWYVEPLSFDELVQHVRVAAQRDFPADRAYVAAALAAGPQELRADPLVQDTWLQLSRDADADVRRALAGESAEEFGLGAVVATDDQFPVSTAAD